MLHGLHRQELNELRQMRLLGHNLRQADYYDLKEYLISIANQNGVIYKHAPVLAADAYEAICLKKVIEAKAKMPKTTEDKSSQTDGYFDTWSMLFGVHSRHASQP